MATYNDVDEAVEWGASGVAILLAKELSGYQVVKRSAKGTGIDWWLGKAGDPLFQQAARLEVSGIMSGDDSVVDKRVKRKFAQVAASDSSGVPALVVIVEFSRPVSRMHLR